MPHEQSFYWPIYAAAVEYGLPVAIYPGSEGTGISGAPAAAGYPSSYVEWHTGLVGSYPAHLLSLVTEGYSRSFCPSSLCSLRAGFAGCCRSCGALTRIGRHCAARRPGSTARRARLCRSILCRPHSRSKRGAPGALPCSAGHVRCHAYAHVLERLPAPSAAAVVAPPPHEWNRAWALPSAGRRTPWMSTAGRPRPPAYGAEVGGGYCDGDPTGVEGGTVYIWV